MAEIVLTTLNARWAHASFGLRYLAANLAEMRDRARILEFDINRRSVDVIEAILAENPKIVGIGVYIWNALPTLQLVGELKRLRPEIVIVIGGPEVSYETDQQPICQLADFVITGEADLAFADLCRRILSGRKPLLRVIPADLPEFECKPGQDSRTIALPYDLYDDTDLKNRVVYVEASRGCPFKCEFCLSSLDVPVRNVPLNPFLGHMQKLLDRGLRQFKFVDRTFNLNLNFSRAILEFFLSRYSPGLFLHFEMIPDRLPEALRDVIAKFPPGALQFEVGIQTFNDDVAERISRRQDNAKVEENLKFLREKTGVHVHSDLIVGLPGETLDSFAAGFDRLWRMGVQEIQVGMLKRLRGTPIARHDQNFAMVYSPTPPYEILQNGVIDFSTMQRMRRFARYWDIVANAGNFIDTTKMLLGSSPFANFMAFSDWLFAKTSQTHAIALPTLTMLVFEFLTQVCRDDAIEVAARIRDDYARCGRKDVPDALRPLLAKQTPVVRHPSQLPARQARHAR